MGNTCTRIRLVNVENEIIKICSKYGIKKENIDISYSNNNKVCIKIKKFFFTFNILLVANTESLDSITCTISETILDKTMELGTFKNIESSIVFVANLINTVNQ